MAEVNRGEIWQFSFPTPDRRRPVLVLTRQEIIGHLHSVTVALLRPASVVYPQRSSSEQNAGLKPPLRSTSITLLPSLRRDYAHLSVPYRPKSSVRSAKHCSLLSVSTISIPNDPLRFLV